MYKEEVIMTSRLRIKVRKLTDLLEFLPLEEEEGVEEEDF